MMLRVDDYRFAFVSVDGISTLISILSSRVNFQVSFNVYNFIILFELFYKFGFGMFFLFFLLIALLGTISTCFLLVGSYIQSIVS